MFRDSIPNVFKLFALVGLAAGCNQSSVSGDGPTPPAPEPEVIAEPEAPQGIIASHKARVKFKGGEVMLRDLSTALDLPRDRACGELGRYDCIKEVHGIALGGVEPYHQAINTPLEVMPVTAAIAADRVALSTCIRRVKLDFDTPAEAVVFGAIAGGAGVPDAAALGATAKVLYDRILRRDATDDEVAALVDFHAEVLAETGGDGRRRWAQMSCFSVATTLEALFY